MIIIILLHRIFSLRGSPAYHRDTQLRILMHQPLASEWEPTFWEGKYQDGIHHKGPAHVTLVLILPVIIHEVNQGFCHP